MPRGIYWGDSHKDHSVEESLKGVGLLSETNFLPLKKGSAEKLKGMPFGLV